MKKFRDWLDNNPGMAAKLAKALDTNTTCPSLVKTGRRPMPTRWFPVVIRMSKKLFTYEELVKARIETAASLRNARKQRLQSGT